MSNSKKLAGAAIWTLALKLFGATSGLLVTLVLARLLSTEDLGYFFIAQSTAVFSALVARFGMKQPIVRLLSTAIANDNLSKIPEVLASVFFIVSTGCALLVAVYWIWGGRLVFVELFSAPIILESILTWFLLLIIVAFQVPVAETYRGLDRSPEAMLFDGPLANGLFLSVLVVVYFFFTGTSFNFVLICFCLASGVSLIFGAKRLLYLFERQSLRFSLSNIKSVLSLGLPVYLFNISTYFASLSGLWICAAALSAGEAAVFGAVYRLMLVISLPLFVLNMVIQSTAVRLFVQGRVDELQRTIRGATTVAALCSLPFTVIAIFFGEKILMVSLGNDYTGGATALSLLAFSSFVSVLLGPCPNFLVLTGHSLASSKIVLSVSVVSISCALFLVEPYGVSGVAFASAFGVIVQSVLAWLVSFRVTGVYTHSYLKIGDVVAFFKDLSRFVAGIRGAGGGKE